MDTSDMEKEWLVGKPSIVAVWAALWVGSAGLLVLGLQPIYLGALLSEGRVNFDQLALAATAEILAIGVGSVAAAFLFGSGGIRIKASLFLLLAAAFDHVSASAASPSSIIAARGAAGLAEGCLLAFAIELIARSRRPGRLGGLFVSLQTFAQGLIAAVLALWVVPQWGSGGCFEMLALVLVASLAAAFFLPQTYGRLPKAADGAAVGIWRGQPITALLAIFSFYMFLGSIWAFLEPLGADAGIGANIVGLMVSVSLGAQILGALAATFVEARLPFRPVLAVAALVAVAVALGIAIRPPAGVFWILAMMTGFIWLFVVPFQISLAVDADAKRGAALLVPAAQLFGAALGPVGASLFVDQGSSAPVAYFAAASAALSIACLLAGTVIGRGAHEG